MSVCEGIQTGTLLSRRASGATQRFSASDVTHPWKPSVMAGFTHALCEGICAQPFQIVVSNRSLQAKPATDLVMIEPTLAMSVCYIAFTFARSLESPCQPDTMTCHTAVV